VATGITENSGVAAPTSSAASGAAAEKMAANLTTPRDAAAQIIAGIEKGSYRVVIGSDARMLDRLARFSLQRATDMIAKRMASLVG
jgi:hypothetical protein